MALLNFFHRFRRDKGNTSFDHRDYVHHLDEPESLDEIATMFPTLKDEDTRGLVPKATVIVTGNEKGGSGKSTTCMHIITGLLNAGKRVATFDLDARQGSLTRYIENRKNFFKKFETRLLISTHVPILFDTIASDDHKLREHLRQNFEHSMQKLSRTHDFIVIDTPGTDNYLSRLGHSYADILVTPINDSFIDLDVLARIDPEDLSIIEHSHYTKMVLEQKEAKKKRYTSSDRFDWIVMRNRLGQMRSSNREVVEQSLQKLSKHIGFELFNGLSERVIYRELFLNGLTLLDIRETDNFTLSSSHSAAKDELRNLFERLNIGIDAEEMMRPTQFHAKELTKDTAEDAPSTNSTD